MSTGQPSQLSEGSGERERDRLRLLVEVNNAVVSNLDLQDLLQSIAAFLRQVIPHDVTGLVVYDEKSNELRAQGVEVLGAKPTFRRGTVLPFEGTPAGLAFTSRKTVLRERIDLNAIRATSFRATVD